MSTLTDGYRKAISAFELASRYDPGYKRLIEHMQSLVDFPPTDCKDERLNSRIRELEQLIVKPFPKKALDYYICFIYAHRELIRIKAHRRALSRIQPSTLEEAFEGVKRERESRRSKRPCLSRAL